jgi:hypothetical protein
MSTKHSRPSARKSKKRLIPLQKQNTISYHSPLEKLAQRTTEKRERHAVSEVTQVHSHGHGCGSFEIQYITTTIVIFRIIPFNPFHFKLFCGFPFDVTILNNVSNIH